MLSGINESTDFDTKDGNSSSDDSSVYSNDSCGDNYNEEQNENKVRDISKLRNGKLMKEVIRTGFGWSTPRFGEEVRVHYVGKLSDGTVFDSSRDRNQPLVFRVGRNEVIKGWDLALRTMKRGEISKFTIAPELAYGEQGMPPDIPPNETLEFEIELFDWILVDCTKSLDKGVCKRIIGCGTGYDNPNMTSKCNIHIIGKYDKRVFDNRNVTFICGQALDSDLIEAIDLVVCRMKIKEKCEVIVKRQYAFNEKQCELFGIPTDYQQLIYEVTLIDFERAKETYELDENEKLEQSVFAKNIGTKYFNDSKYSSAVRQYKRIHKLFAYLEHFSDDEIKSKRDELLLAAYLNLSLCYLKLNDDNKALKYSNLALKMDPKNVKALFRRGLSHFKQSITVNMCFWNWFRKDKKKKSHFPRSSSSSSSSSSSATTVARAAPAAPPAALRAAQTTANETQTIRSLYDENSTIRSQLEDPQVGERPKTPSPKKEPKKEETKHKHP